MKRKTTFPKSRVTVKDLEREITDLRIGLGKQTEMMAALSRENRALREANDQFEMFKKRDGFVCDQLGRQLREEQREHAKTRTALTELISKMPAPSQVR